MKRNYNGVSKGKVIPLTEVKPGMVFRMARNGRAVHSFIFWCTNLGRIRTDCSSRISAVGLHGPDHNHWLDDDDGGRQAIVIRDFDPKAVRV